MGFFDMIAAASDDAEPPPEPVTPAWYKQEDVVPRLVAVERVLAQTEDAAIAMSGLWCYPNGFEFGIDVVLRKPDRRGRLLSAMQMHHMLEAGDPIPPEVLRVGLQWSDGTRLTNLPRSSGAWPRGKGPDGPIMLPGGRGGGNRSHNYQFWVWPLPPPGPMTVVCEWPHFHIGQTETTIDAQVILDAAARAVPLWPEP
jgi:hypothetical protein